MRLTIRESNHTYDGALETAMMTTMTLLFILYLLTCMISLSERYVGQRLGKPNGWWPTIRPA